MTPSDLVTAARSQNLILLFVMFISRSWRVVLATEATGIFLAWE